MVMSRIVLIGAVARSDIGTKRPTGEIVRYVARHSRVGVWLGAAVCVDLSFFFASLLSSL